MAMFSFALSSFDCDTTSEKQTVVRGPVQKCLRNHVTKRCVFFQKKKILVLVLSPFPRLSLPSQSWLRVIPLLQRSNVFRSWRIQFLFRGNPWIWMFAICFVVQPLSLNPDSQWSQYFKDNEMLVQIDKDCRYVSIFFIEVGRPASWMDCSLLFVRSEFEKGSFTLTEIGFQWHTSVEFEQTIYVSTCTCGFHCRRLCPDLSFFQSATNFPCKVLVSPEQNFNSLRKRVEHSVLKSENVTKNRLGITLADVSKCAQLFWVFLCKWCRNQRKKPLWTFNVPFYARWSFCVVNVFCLFFLFFNAYMNRR